MSKLNLVNPLNPNQIIKTEDISDQVNTTVDNTSQSLVNNTVDNNINQNVVQNNMVSEPNFVQNNATNQNVQPSFEHLNETTNSQPNSEDNNSNKKKLLIMVVSAIVVLGIIVGVALFFTLGNSNNEIPKEPNNGENENNNSNTQQPTTISINNIVDSFNKNVSIFPLETGSDVKAEIEENSIRISINYAQSILYYSFSLNNRNLSTTIMKDDELGFKIAAYVISSVSSYYGHDFNATYNYITNNKDSLSSVNRLGVTELEKLLIISVNIDNPVVEQ